MSEIIVSVVMPVFNTEKFVKAAIESVLAQTFRDFELLIIDDQGTDRSIAICRSIHDPRLKIIQQNNRGLAGARNTGIRNARGKYIALLDSDDLWEPEKLAMHVDHFDASLNVGISFTGARLIDEDGHILAITQKPALSGITAAKIFLRNPIGNGSTPVIRREVFDAIGYRNPHSHETDYFDQTFRQSEDIECWMRMALTTHWKFEGLTPPMTRYRINRDGLSANIDAQYRSWLRVRDKVRLIRPDFAKKWESAAEAYQLRYLARRSIQMHEADYALTLALRSLRKYPQMLIIDPAKTLSTLAATIMIKILPVLLATKLYAKLIGAPHDTD